MLNLRFNKMVRGLLASYLLILTFVCLYVPWLGIRYQREVRASESLVMRTSLGFSWLWSPPESTRLTFVVVDTARVALVVIALTAFFGSSLLFVGLKPSGDIGK